MGDQAEILDDQGMKEEVEEAMKQAEENNNDDLPEQEEPEQEAVPALTEEQTINLKYNSLTALGKTGMTKENKEELDSLSKKKATMDEEYYKALSGRLVGEWKSLSEFNIEAAWKVLDSVDIETDASKIREQIDNVEVLKEKLISLQVEKTLFLGWYVQVIRRAILIDRIRKLAKRIWIFKSQAPNATRAEGEAEEKTERLAILWGKYESLQKAYESAWFNFISAQETYKAIASIVEKEISAGLRGD